MEHKIQRAVCGAVVALLGALFGFPSVGIAFGASTFGGPVTKPDVQSGAAEVHDFAGWPASGGERDSGATGLEPAPDELALPEPVPVDDERGLSAPAVADYALERALTGVDGGLAAGRAIASAPGPETNDEEPPAEGAGPGRDESTDRRGDNGGESTRAPESGDSVAPPRPARTVHVDGLVEDPWEAVRWCESRDRYDINTGNGFYGAYQFTIATWDWVAGLTDRADLVGLRPDLADPADQDFMADALAFDIPGGGLGHWPVCGAYYGT